LGIICLPVCPCIMDEFKGAEKGSTSVGLFFFLPTPYTDLLGGIMDEFERLRDEAQDALQGMLDIFKELGDPKLNGDKNHVFAAAQLLHTIPYSGGGGRQIIPKTKPSVKRA